MHRARASWPTIPLLLVALLLPAAASGVHPAAQGTMPGIEPGTTASHAGSPEARPGSAVPAAPPVAAQDPAPVGRPLTLEDYARWNRITEVEISPDGTWMTYARAPNEGDATLLVRQLDTGAVHEVQNGSDPRFSSDSRWVGYLVSPPEEEAERLREEGEPVPWTFELRDLAGDATVRIDDTVGFEFSGDGRWVAAHKRQADSEAEHDGADLIVRELETGATRNLGNVSAWAFDEAGGRLAWLVDAADGAGNGVYVMDLDAGRLAPLDSEGGRYSRLTWHEDGAALAALRGETPEGMEQRANALLVFREPTPASPASGRVVYDPAEDPDFPAGMVLSEHGDVEFSTDGSRLFMGIKEQREEVETDDEEDRPNVDIWHWKDERVQSEQMRQAERDRRRTWASVVLLDAAEPRLVRLADEDMRDVTPADDGTWALGRDDSAYRDDRDEPGGRADYYRVDTSTGERSPLAEEIRHAMGTSPDSRWFLWLEDEKVLARDVESDRTTDLSAVAGVDFVNRDFDRPTEKPAWGVTGWTADGAGVIIDTEYDLWFVPLDPGPGNGADDSDTGSAGGAAPDGEAYNLTAGLGEEQRIRFRHEDLDPEEEAIDTSGPVLLSAYGDRTKKSGYWEVVRGEDPRPLIWEDRMVDDLEKADEADRVVFTRQTIVEFPDWWVADTSFGDPRKVTDANPQQSEYAWTPGRVLVDYTDDRGNELQATLTLPAGYREGQRYPMLVYFYEQMSQRHHQYSMPVYDDRPHMSTYASNGYLVLMPDVVYDVGKPGSSALDDLTAAVERVVELGYADPERVGLQGHSWGGYQSSYVVTRTDIFACVVTGAPLTSLVSMHNILYKRTGNPNAPLIQWGQGRMGVAPFEDLSAYVEESPVHQAEGITTPFMILHGTEDGAVDWNQGLELYITARRLGKEVILLSYPGEPHHLQDEANQKDFQVRMREYFDHYLKGAPAPRWLAEGIPYLDKGREEGR